MTTRRMCVCAGQFVATASALAAPLFYTELLRDAECCICTRYLLVRDCHGISMLDNRRIALPNHTLMSGIA